MDEAVRSDLVEATRIGKRRRLFLIFGSALVVAALGVAAWWWLVASHYVSTDNAYVVADTANVMSQTEGTVAEVPAAETLVVKRGDVLVVLDDADARIAVARAEADYARAMRRVQQYFEDDKAVAADVAYAQAVLQQASTELTRLRNLGTSGAVSAQELTRAQAAYETARAALAAARGKYESQLALTAKSAPDSHPEVLAARAELEAAQLTLTRAVIRAPIAGTVTQKRVALGQRVQVGTPLLSIVPADAMSVMANFKEVQLERVRVGQRATMTADLYGGDVVYRGRVIGIGGGTGAAFSVIPAQNATGTWIKIVQRVPVKIALDPAELAAHPLRVGLSMQVEVNLRD